VRLRPDLRRTLSRTVSASVKLRASAVRSAERSSPDIYDRIHPVHSLYRADNSHRDHFNSFAPQSGHAPTTLAI